MQKYVIVGFLEKAPAGLEFEAVDWPLHVSMAPRFMANLGRIGLMEALEHLAAKTDLLQLTAAEDAMFGPGADIPVTTIVPIPEIQQLHNDVYGLLNSEGATFDEVRYTGESYKPHVTIQKHSRVHTGDSLTIDSISVVDMYPNQDVSRRKILKTFMLLD